MKLNTHVIVAKIASGRIFNFLHNGKNAGITIRYVVEPEPSKCPITEAAATANNTNVTLFPTRLVSALIAGSNSPLSPISVKNEIENTNKIVVFIILDIPPFKKPAISFKLNPQIKAAIKGSETNATGGATYPFNNTKIKPNPTTANIVFI